MAEVQIRRLSVIADATGNQLLLMDAIPFKEVIHWTLICARNEGTNIVRVELVLMQGRVEFILRSSVPAGVRDTVSSLQDVYATGDYRVGARFIGAAKDDELELYAYGVVQREFPLE